MSNDQSPVALRAADCPPRARPSNYPAAIRDWLEAKLAGREKRPLGDRFGLTNFGVNLTRLAPGAISALRHAHTLQDEFIYVLEGEVTLITNAGEQVLTPGMCAGFPAGVADGHHLVNRGSAPARFLEVGDRLPGDTGHYSEIDLAARSGRTPYVFTRRDGSAY
jgi:uncharacterized cupin superfamily protein